MEIAITKLSPNGQVVIPSEVRRDAGIEPSTKFLVFNEGGNILLKPIRKADLRRELALLARVKRSERQIKAGRVVRATTKMRDEKIDGLLMD